MEWWQILLIGVASLGVGMLLGNLLHYLLKRFGKKRETTSTIEEPVAEVPAIEKPAAEVPAIEEPAAEVLVIEEPAAEVPAIEEPVTEVPVKETSPLLLEEVEHNIKIATESWTGELLPFQTHIWDTLQDGVNQVPINLQEDLAQIYIDIRLANSIVRLSTEFDRKSPSLDESYMKLRTTIAQRLDKIKPLIEQPGE